MLPDEKTATPPTAPPMTKEEIAEVAVSIAGIPPLPWHINDRDTIADANGDEVTGVEDNVVRAVLAVMNASPRLLSVIADRDRTIEEREAQRIAAGDAYQAIERAVYEGHNPRIEWTADLPEMIRLQRSTVESTIADLQKRLDEAEMKSR